MLDRSRPELPADFFQQFIPAFPLIAGYLDLDQFVTIESLVHFMQYTLGQALRSYPDDRLEQMRAGTECAAVSRTKHQHALFKNTSVRDEARQNQ